MSTEVFVARDSDFNVLKDAWSQVNEGNAKTVLLTAPYGGGKSAWEQLDFQKSG